MNDGIGLGYLEIGKAYRQFSCFLSKQRKRAEIQISLR